MKDIYKFKSVGEWRYGIRTYDIGGKTMKPYVHIYHKRNHWTNLNGVPTPVEKCQCGEEIPAILRVFILLVDSGAWNATLGTSTAE